MKSISLKLLNLVNNGCLYRKSSVSEILQFKYFYIAILRRMYWDVSFPLLIGNDGVRQQLDEMHEAVIYHSIRNLFIIMTIHLNYTKDYLMLFIISRECEKVKSRTRTKFVISDYPHNVQLNKFQELWFCSRQINLWLMIN